MEVLERGIRAPTSYRYQNLTVSVSTRQQRRAMAPPACIERGVTWCAWKPMWGRAAAVVWRVLVTIPPSTINLIFLYIVSRSQTMHRSQHQQFSLPLFFLIRYPPCLLGYSPLQTSSLQGLCHGLIYKEKIRVYTTHDSAFSSSMYKCCTPITSQSRTGSTRNFTSSMDFETTDLAQERLCRT